MGGGPVTISEEAIAAFLAAMERNGYTSVQYISEADVRIGLEAATPLIGCGTGLIPGDRCPCYLAGQIDAVDALDTEWGWGSPRVEFGLRDEATARQVVADHLEAGQADHWLIRRQVGPWEKANP